MKNWKELCEKMRVKMKKNDWNKMGNKRQTVGNRRRTRETRFFADKRRWAPRTCRRCEERLSPGALGWLPICWQPVHLP